MHDKICDAGHTQDQLPFFFISDIDLAIIDFYRFIPFQRVKTRTIHLEITKFSFLMTFTLVSIDLNWVHGKFIDFN